MFDSLLFYWLRCDKHNSEIRFDNKFINQGFRNWEMLACDCQPFVNPTVHSVWLRALHEVEFLPFNILRFQWVLTVTVIFRLNENIVVSYADLWIGSMLMSSKNSSFYDQRLLIVCKLENSDLFRRRHVFKRLTDSQLEILNSEIG